MTDTDHSLGGLSRLLRPRSIAVFGGREAARVVEQCERIGCEADIWPVHPSRIQVGGRLCYRSVNELPGIPDAAFIGVNRQSTIGIVRALSERGCGGAVVYAAGFAEASDSVSEGLQRDLVEAAGPMAVLGPNCYGFINYLDGALLWPDQHGGSRAERGVAIIAQSSNIAINLTMQQRGLPVAYVITVGNQGQRDVADVIDAVAADGRVSAVGLYLEGVRNASRFERAVNRARERGIPVVTIKAGRSEQARAATLSHTASVAGSDVAVDAFFDRLGVARVHSLSELLETLKLLHVHGPLPGGDICAITSSGGERALLADALEGRALRFRPVHKATSRRLRAILGEFADITNPLDFRTDVWGNEPVLRETFSAMLGEDFDLSLFVVDFPREDRCDAPGWPESIRALEHAVGDIGNRAAVVTTLPDNMPESWATSLIKRGIAPLCGLHEGLAAVEAAALIGRRWRDVAAKPVFQVTPASANRLVSHEVQAKRRLTAYGLHVPPSSECTDPGEAADAAEALGYPVVVKATGVSHKTESDGVALGLRSAEEVRRAARRLGASGSSVLVEGMVEDGVAELMVGVTCDPQFGLLLTLGAGGTLVELLGDTVSLLLPSTESDLRAALMRLRIAPLLCGYRGRAAADLDAGIEAIEAITRFAQDHVESLRELDVNPLILRRDGQGAVAVDALIVEETT